MTLHRLRCFISPTRAALLIGALAAACSSATPPTADAYVDASVGAGPMSTTAQCKFATQNQFLTLGTPTNPPTTAKDGSNDAGGHVAVQCTVKPGSGGFDIQLTATKSGLSGGTLIVSGHVTAGGGGDALTGVFNAASAGGIDFRAVPQDGHPCTLDFNGVSDMPPVGPGHISGHVVCPTATMAAQMRQCQGEATFKFENCSDGS